MHKWKDICSSTYGPILTKLYGRGTEVLLLLTFKALYSLNPRISERLPTFVQSGLSNLVIGERSSIGIATYRGGRGGKKWTFSVVAPIVWNCLPHRTTCFLLRGFLAGPKHMDM